MLSSACDSLACWPPAPRSGWIHRPGKHRFAVILHKYTRNRAEHAGKSSFVTEDATNQFDMTVQRATKAPSRIWHRRLVPTKSVA